MRTIDWKNTAKNLQQLRRSNFELRRYVCRKLRVRDKECDGTECDNCIYEMDNAISQKELAEVFGVTESTVANWENGRAIPNLDFLLFYSDICKIELLGGVVIFKK